MDFGPPFGEVFVHAPEDLILYKLWYFSLSQQPRHPRDIAAILSAQRDHLDDVYIQSWVTRLGLAAIWEELSTNRHPDRDPENFCPAAVRRDALF